VVDAVDPPEPAHPRGGAAGETHRVAGLGDVHWLNLGSGPVSPVFPDRLACKGLLKPNRSAGAFLSGSARPGPDVNGRSNPPSQFDGTDGYNLASQGAQGYFGAGAENFHEKPGQSLCHGGSEWFSHARQTAAQHDNLRVEQMHYVGEAEGKVFRDLLEQLGCQRVASS